MIPHGASRRILRPHGAQSNRGALHTREEDILELDGEVRKKCVFELEKIKKKTEKLCNKLGS
jgi:hypothetical protein